MGQRSSLEKKQSEENDVTVNGVTFQLKYRSNRDLDFVFDSENEGDMTKAVELYRKDNFCTFDTDMQKGLIESVKQIIQDNNYTPNRLYKTVRDITHPLNNISDSKPHFTGYKLVCILSNGFLNMNAAALIEIAINTAADPISGKEYTAAELKSGVNYITPSCKVNQVWIFGQTVDVEIAYNALKRREAKLVSNFDPQFEYTLSEVSQEPEFGKQGKGCLQGIHFFIDKKSAFKFIKTNFIPIDTFDLVLSQATQGSDLADEKVERIQKISNNLEIENPLFKALKETLSVHGPTVQKYLVQRMMTTWHEKYNRIQATIDESEMRTAFSLKDDIVQPNVSSTVAEESHSLSTDV